MADLRGLGGAGGRPPPAARPQERPQDQSQLPGSPRGEPEFEILRETSPPSLLRRFLVTWRHVSALVIGGLAAYTRALPAHRRPLRIRLLRLLLAIPALLVRRDLKSRPFPVQLRRRLEMLGPTYIKLGQVLSLREDLLPREITGELKNLFDRLPALPGARFIELVSEHLGRSAEEVFAYVQFHPLASASIGQIHLARTHQGERVILKVVKPGIRETLQRDTILLRLLGACLQLLVPRFQPRRVIREFCDYTLREADLRLEADNAETFAANFRDQPSVVFPRIHREFSSRDLLCMEYLDGLTPTDPRAAALPLDERERLVDLGAQAIIRMLYRDGFFHADLHPGNLVILPGGRCGFIDLGMVGRFDEELKRALLYYFYCLTMGDAENASRYLTALAQPGPGADPRGFRRDVEDICRRWSRGGGFQDFSLGQLILESVGRGAAHRMAFPVELVLMVKAIVTFEGVGNILLPGFDVAQISKRHVTRILVERFTPLRMAQESLRGAPELLETLVKVPSLITEGLRLLEQATHRPAENPFVGIRGTLFGGFCLVAGAIFAALGGPWPIWAALVAIGILLPLRRGR